MQQQTVERILWRHDRVWILAFPPRSDARTQGRPILKKPRRLGTRSSRGRANTLELAFDSKSLRAICESEAQAKLELGATVAEVLKHRLSDLRAATSAEDLLVGRPRIVTDQKHMVIDLCDGYRIVFKANHPNYPRAENDELDWAKVNRIKVLRIERDNA